MITLALIALAVIALLLVVLVQGKWTSQDSWFAAVFAWAVMAMVIGALNRFKACVEAELRNEESEDRATINRDVMASETTRRPANTSKQR
jgi:hypothetical protein